MAGVEYMHEGGLAHLDLSLENCVLGTRRKRSRKTGLLKEHRGPVIIDFGTSLSLAPGSLADRFAGKLTYMAPEVSLYGVWSVWWSYHSPPPLMLLWMRSQLLANQRFDAAKADVWSAGIVLFMLLFNCGESLHFAAET